MELNEIPPDKAMVLLVSIGLVFALSFYCILTIGKLDKAERRIVELAAQKTCYEQNFNSAMVWADKETVTCYDDWSLKSAEFNINFNTSVAYEQCCCLTGVTNAGNKCQC